MAEGYDRIPLIVDDSSTDTFGRRELDVPQYKSYKVDDDDGRFVTVGGDVDIEKAGSSADGGDRTELVGQADGNKIKLAEALNAGSLQHAKLKLTDRLRRASDEARKAAYNSRRTAACCLSTMQNTLYVLNVEKARVSEVIASAEKAERFDEATRNYALANNCNIAVELATTGMQQIQAAAKSAENSSVNAYLASVIIANFDGNDAEVEEKLSLTHSDANSANTAAVVVNKIEYAAVKAVRNSLKDIDPERLEFEGIMSPSEERTTTRRSIRNILRICCCGSFSFIFGIIILVSYLTKTKFAEDTKTFTVTMACIMVAVPILYVLYEICMCCRNKRREALEKKNRNIIILIDKRLLKLEEFFESNNISLESVDQEFDCIFSMAKLSP